MPYNMADPEFMGKAWFNTTSASEHFLIIFKHPHSRPMNADSDSGV
jgi:hypothetical protein